MQWLAAVSVRRPVFATVLILVLVVVGLVGYKSLGVDKFPKIDFPLVTIVTPYPGAAPTAVETDVTQRIERLQGVGQIVILGGQLRQINVLLDPIRLAAAGVSAVDVQRAIASSNVNIPGGRIETGPTNTSLRIEGRSLDPMAI